MGRNDRPIHITDPKEIFDEAESFLKASQAINNSAVRHHLKDPNQGIRMTFAAYVNHAYSFELYLKCLMGIEKGVFYMGHDLVELFGKLSKATQSKIIDYHNKGVIYSTQYYIIHGFNKKTDFLSLLKEASNAFLDFRYLFDGKKTNNYELDFPIKYVKWVILELRPSYEIPNSD